MPASAQPRGRLRLALYTAGPWLAVAVVLALYAALWGDAGRFVAAVDNGGDELFCDFIRHFLPTGRWLYQFNRPALGFVYPPFAAILFAPLGALSPRTAVGIWVLIQVMATAALILLPQRALLAGRPWLRTGNAVLVLTAVPILHSFRWGQVSVVIVALSLAAVWLREEGRLWLPAVLLAVAASIKLYPALLLVYPLLRRDMRFVAATLGCAALFTFAVPALLMGPGAAWQFWVAARAQANLMLEFAVWRNPNSQFVAHVAGRLWHHGDLARGLGFRLLGLAVTGANMVLLWRIVRARVPRAAWWGVLLGFGSVPFLIETSWPHYLAFLPFMQVLIGLAILDSRAPGHIVRALATASWIVCVVGSSVLALIAVGHWAPLAHYGFVFFANLAALLAAWLLLVPQLASASQSATGEPAALVASTLANDDASA